MDLSKLGKLFPIIFGGTICFAAAYLLLVMSGMIIYQILRVFGCVGLLTFKEVIPAIDILLLVIVYLPSGFLGGLYTGYRMKKNLRIILIYPSLIGLAALTLLRVYSGALELNLEGLGRDVLLPLAGITVGSYLGGYTISWKEEEEEEV